MTVHLLLFDFDGVLVDSLDIYSTVVRTALQKIGMTIIQSKEDYLDLFDGNFYESLKQKGVDLEAFSRVLPECRATIDFSKMKTQPGLQPVLEQLSRSDPLMIISSNDSSTIRKLLQRVHWEPYFSQILGADYLYSKRDKISVAMQMASIGPDRTYYIGDTVGDVKEARAAGAKSVVVSWGWHAKQRLARAGPDIIVDRPEELLDLEK
jgi:phosphoglycolate phosphatase